MLCQPPHPTDKCFALTLVFCRGAAQAVSALLVAGADPYKLGGVGISGWTALMGACLGSHDTTVDAFVAAGIKCVLALKWLVWGSLCHFSQSLCMPCFRLCATNRGADRLCMGG